MKIFLIIITLLISYLIGSIPIGFLIVKRRKNIDIREYGSHNVGATNVSRIMGKKIGALCGILDILKAVIVILILYLLILLKVDISLIRYVSINNMDVSIIPIYGFAAVVGHSYSIFLKFGGGKAVACSIAVILVTEPIIGVIALTIFLILLKITRYVSLSSMLATFSVLVYTPFYNIFFNAPTNHLFKYIPSTDFLTSFTSSIFIILIASLCSFLIFYKHKENIKRLFKGEENKSE